MEVNMKFFKKIFGKSEVIKSISKESALSSDIHMEDDMSIVSNVKEINLNQILSKRTGFKAMSTSEVLQPTFLPKEYYWLQKGYYAFYKGVQEQGNWGWEINFINGLTNKGEFSSLGYTIYVEEKRPFSGHQSLNFPALWSSFFLQPILGYENIDTFCGKKKCFKIQKHGGGFSGPGKVMFYDSDTFILIKIDFLLPDGKVFYSGSISESNIF
jgi:hypothetical protein